MLQVQAELEDANSYEPQQEAIEMPIDIGICQATSSILFESLPLRVRQGALPPRFASLGIFLKCACLLSVATPRRIPVSLQGGTGRDPDGRKCAWRRLGRLCRAFSLRGSRYSCWSVRVQPLAARRFAYHHSISYPPVWMFCTSQCQHTVA